MEQETIAKNIEAIRARIAAAAGGRHVKLMGVTKFHAAGEVEAAAGLIDLIGENRVQEAAAKRGEIKVATPAWHMIGRLQRNKIRRAMQTFDVIESIDSYETADTAGRIAEELGITYPVFIEVNISKEPAKGGIAEEALEKLMLHILEYNKHLAICGLMGVASDTDDERLLHSQFGALRLLQEQMRIRTGLPINELSMGMSGDFETAIQEGSTIVRVGSAIFGPRIYNK